MTKYLLTRIVPEGMGGRRENRVVNVPEGETVPDGAVPQADETPLTDWTPVAAAMPRSAFAAPKFPAQASIVSPSSETAQEVSQ